MKNIVILRKRGVKRWRISIDREARARVTAPLKMSDREIAALIDKHAAWIAKQLSRREAAIAAARSEYEKNGGKIPLLGEWIEPPNGDLERFYRAEAKRFFEEKCAKFAAAIGKTYAKITIRDQKTRYGSCSSRGTLSFSRRVVKAPKFVAEYLAAHEVAHLAEMNHGARFWAIVAALAPDYQAAEKWLKNNAEFLRSGF